jgi:hypothetical protein
MQDRRDDGPPRDRRERDGDRPGGRGGPEGTEFLDLEISKVLLGEASSLAREAAREILKEAVKARLRERLGERLEAIGRLAADVLCEDIEANLAIEERIGARREERKEIERRLREALAGGEKKPDG